MEFTQRFSYLKNTLKSEFGLEGISELIECLCQINNCEEFREYLLDIIGTHDEKNDKIINKIIDQIFNAKKLNIPKNKKIKQKNINPQNNIIPGKRIQCNCQASVHDLVNNCLSCGRIVCLQEGEGNCFFCGTFVRNRTQRRFVDQEGDFSLKRAVDNKNKLLEFDRNSEQRTRVIDDQMDYFATNKWSSNSEKAQIEELVTKSQNSSDKFHMAINMENFEISDITDSVKAEEKSRILLKAKEIQEAKSKNIPENINHQQKQTPQFIPTRILQSCDRESQLTNIHDRELLEMRDLGLCLPLDQPFASQVVDGEIGYVGMDDYTGHRGRIWVASSLVRRSGDGPVGVLLGCVSLRDVVPVEEFEGEAVGRFVYIFGDCSLLVKPLAVRPKSCKIFRLDQGVHSVARQFLLC